MSETALDRDPTPTAVGVEIPPPAGRSMTAKEGWIRRLPLLSALVFTIVVTQIPFLLTLFYSFQQWILLRPRDRRFAGFDNYLTVLTDADFRTAVLNSVIMTAGAVVGAVVVGLLLAVLLDRQFRGRSITRTLLITPFLVMPAASALVWKTSILDATNGIVNWLLGPFGGGNIEWASQYPMLTVITYLIWQWTPFMMLILLAGLQAQPTDILEAARVDGAAAMGIFWHLTMPHLRPYIELTATLGTIYIVQTFDPVFLITQGGPGNATTNLPYFLYLETFRSGNIGVASAAGVLVVIASVIIATFALRLVGSVFREGVGR